MDLRFTKALLSGSDTSADFESAASAEAPTVYKTVAPPKNYGGQIQSVAMDYDSIGRSRIERGTSELEIRCSIRRLMVFKTIAIDVNSGLDGVQ